MTAPISRPASPAGGLAPVPRLTLASTGSAPALLDGAWWPRSRDLDAELPALAAVLDPLWGRITRITVNPGQWPVIPLMAAASDPTRTSTGSALMAEAAHLGDVAETDRTVEAL